MRGGGLRSSGKAAGEFGKDRIAGHAAENPHPGAATEAVRVVPGCLQAGRREACTASITLRACQMADKSPSNNPQSLTALHARTGAMSRETSPLNRKRSLPRPRLNPLFAPCSAKKGEAALETKVLHSVRSEELQEDCPSSADPCNRSASPAEYSSAFRLPSYLNSQIQTDLVHRGY